MGNFKEARDMNAKLLLVCIACMAAYAHAASATVTYFSDNKCTTAITNGTCAKPTPTCTTIKTEFKQPNAACKVSGCKFSFTGLGNTNCATVKKGYDTLGCAAASVSPLTYRKIVVTCGGAATVGMSALAGIAALFSFF